MKKDDVCGCCGTGRSTSRALVILKPEEQMALLGKDVGETPPVPGGKSGGEQVAGVAWRQCDPMERVSHPQGQDG